MDTEEEEPFNLLDNLPQDVLLCILVHVALGPRDMWSRRSLLRCIGVLWAAWMAAVLRLTTSCMLAWAPSRLCSPRKCQPHARAAIRGCLPQSGLGGT